MYIMGYCKFGFDLVTVGPFSEQINLLYSFGSYPYSFKP